MSPTEATVDPLSRGSRLDADHPENGVLIPCRFTAMERPATSGQVGEGPGVEFVRQRGSLGSPALERPSKAQLMAVGIGNVKEALAPFRIARRRLDQVAGGDQSGI